MIKATDILHHYGYRPVLDGLSFEIPRGELVAVMGPNGVGKSTILQLAAGILSPLEGQVEIEGVERRSSEQAEHTSVAEIYEITPRRIMGHPERRMSEGSREH